MSDVTVNFFHGSVPRLASHLIKPGLAKRAVDCKLTNGTLDSWREPDLFRETPEGTLGSYQLDCCWLDFDKCVDIAFGPVTCKQVFVTGWRDYPVVLEIEGDECEVSERRLGVPCPDRPPSILVGAVDPSRSAPKDVEGRSYAYQYVNGAGVRGALSPGVEARNIHDGQSVVVSGWVVPDSEWDVTTIRIYRTVSGQSEGTELGRSIDTTWMFVAEVPITDASFTDTLYNDELIEALEEDVAYPPPAGLQGIIWIESINTLAGHVGNRIYFSENNTYDHWPHWMDLDDNICAMVESNGDIYVATDGHPYVIKGAVDCENAGCRSAVRLPFSMPMIGCGSRRIEKLNSGAVYPSHKGLVLLSGNNQPVYLTWSLYSEDEWQAIHPETAIPVQHDGKLFVFARNGAFVMTLPQGPESGWDADMHSELSDRGVLDAFVTRTGDFMILKPDGLYQWNRGSGLRPHQWESHVHVDPRPRSYGAGHIFFQYGPENVKIEVDQRVVLNRQVLSSRVFRLPMWAYGTRWKFTLSGTGQVSLLSLSESMQGLGR